MARWSIAALLAFNLVLAAWNLGALARWGWAPDDGREPERLRQQIEPEAITVRPAETLQATAPDAAEASAPSTPPH